MSHILEDVFFVGPRDDLDFRNYLTHFLYICKKIGVRLTLSKTQSPPPRLTKIIKYGIEIDSEIMHARLHYVPIDKVGKKLALEKMSNKESSTLKDLQSLIGLLNFACSVKVPGRAFRRIHIDLM